MQGTPVADSQITGRLLEDLATHGEIKSNVEKQLDKVFHKLELVVPDNVSLSIINSVITSITPVSLYVASVASKAQALFDYVQTEYDIWWAKIMTPQVEEAKNARLPTTAEFIRNKVISLNADGYRQWQHVLAGATELVGYYKNVRVVLDKQSSALQTLSANIREELRSITDAE